MVEQDPFRRDPTPEAEEPRHPILNFLTSVDGVTLVLILLLVLYPGWHPLVRGGLVAGYFIVWLTPWVRDHCSIIFRCVLPVLIGAICVEVYVLFSEWNIDLSYLRLHDDYRESFYSGIATLYAIITALALVKGIEDFDSIKKNVTDEAYKIRSISEMTYYFENTASVQTREAVLALKNKLLSYATNVYSFKDQHLNAENLRLLRDCQRDIAQMTPEDQNDHNALVKIMEAHGELGILRSRRIASIGEKIPHYLIWALWLMALGQIAPFMVKPLEENSPAILGQYYIIFLMGALNSFLLLMLNDIADPFDGFWVVDLGPFRRLAEALRDDLAERPVLVHTAAQ